MIEASPSLDAKTERLMTETPADLRLAAAPIAKAEMLIRKPAAEVFAAFVDPAITANFWFTKGSGRLEPGTPRPRGGEMRRPPYLARGDGRRGEARQRAVAGGGRDVSGPSRSQTPGAGRGVGSAAGRRLAGLPLA